MMNEKYGITTNKISREEESRPSTEERDRTHIDHHYTFNEAAGEQLTDQYIKIDSQL
jgi:hypothetical protein